MKSISRNLRRRYNRLILFTLPFLFLLPLPYVQANDDFLFKFHWNAITYTLIITEKQMEFYGAPPEIVRQDKCSQPFIQALRNDYEFAKQQPILKLPATPWLASLTEKNETFYFSPYTPLGEFLFRLPNRIHNIAITHQQDCWK